MKRSRKKLQKMRERAVKKYREKRRKLVQEGKLKPSLGGSSAHMRRRHPPTTGFRLWVRATAVCCVPGCWKESPDPHHVSARKAGRSSNPWAEDVSNVAPLCRYHHQLGDSPGWSWRRFQRELKVDLPAVARAVWDRWMALPAEERAKWEGRAYRLNVKRGAKPARRPS